LASTGYPSRPRSFLPRDPRVEEPYRLTPQLAFRIGILGALALAAFALLILRLWALQVLSGDDYLRIAKNNQLRRIRVEATRGQILDRYGRVLVDNRSVTSVRVWPSALPEKRRYQEMKRLSRVLHVSLAEMLTKVERQKDDPVTPITVLSNVPYPVVAWLQERQAEFPGVRIEETQVRRYPRGEVASQTLGNVGEIDKDQLKELKGYRLGDRIGQRGVEAAFDRYLRGKPGLAQVRINAAGRPLTDPTLTLSPTAGDSVRLTLDAKLQAAAEQAIAKGIELANQNDNWYAAGGAAVAMKPATGEVLALASWPRFQPGVFSNPHLRAGLPEVLDDRPGGAAERANYPGLNRAIVGEYPPGSIFKPVTALAAMQEGLLSPYQSINCPATYVIKDAYGNPIPGGIFHNWNGTSSGPLTLSQALEQSCDTYFYDVGMSFYKQPGDRHPLQEWARRWGFGHPTGLDIGGEASGLLPTPEWRKATYTKKTDPCCWAVDRIWKPGDSVQLAIGQKDLTVTPLQMASFYSMIANQGKIVRPHLFYWVQEPGTRRSGPLVRRRYSAPPAVDSRIDPAALSAVQQGLYAATHGNEGTATSVFSSFPIDIAGKTGTAEKIVRDINPYEPTPQSWFCGYGPTQGAPELTVCVIIENGGFGAEAAAPAALKIFQAYFHQQGGNPSSVHAD
jgi:penicillin-binding protein 2